MTWFTGIIAFLLIWWTALFAVLPWGLKHDFQANPKEQLPGAPVNPNLRKKFIATTLVSVVIWLLIYFLIKLDIIDFRAISMSMIEGDEL